MKAADRLVDSSRVVATEDRTAVDRSVASLSGGRLDPTEAVDGGKEP